jgi:cysteinyl-tRNA synthetase
MLASTLKFLGGLLGILQDDPEQFLKGQVSFEVTDQTRISGLLDDQINQQIQARLDAKKAKNWALADQIRDDLKKQGIILEDAPNGTTSWRRE